MTSPSQFETGFKKAGRGMARASLDLIEAMRAAAETAQPITGRGIGYKLFIGGVISSMCTSDMQRVYRLLKLAREQGIIPWSWIVDETRELERVASWDDPADYVRAVSRSYRRDFWKQRPIRVVVASKKGRYAEFSGPFLTTTASGSLSCTDSPARRQSTTSLRMMTADR